MNVQPQGKVVLKSCFPWGGMHLFKAASLLVRGLVRGCGLVLNCWLCKSCDIVQVRRKNADGAGQAGVAGRTLRGVVGLAGFLLLTACAGKAEPEIRYVRVEVPVQVPCRAPDVAVPIWAAASLRKLDPMEVKVRALLAERRQRMGYQKLLEAALTACR